MNNLAQWVLIVAMAATLMVQGLVLSDVQDVVKGQLYGQALANKRITSLESNQFEQGESRRLTESRITESDNRIEQLRLWAWKLYEHLTSDPAKTDVQSCPAPPAR